MAKINFKQPKFILPLIIFPFLILGFFVYTSFKAKGNKGRMTLEDSLVLVQQKGINIEMPGVSKEIREEAVKDKFSAYQEAYKNEKDFSAINSLGTVTNTEENRIGTAYNTGDIQKLEGDRKLDSIRRVLDQRRKMIEERMDGLTQPSSLGERQKGRGHAGTLNQSQEQLLAALKSQAQTPYNNSYNPYAQAQNTEHSVNTRKPLGGSYEEQIRLFKEQMKMVDSMQKMNAPKKSTDPQDESAENIKKKFDPTRDTSFKPLPVTVADEPRHASSFNTLRKFKAEENIRAIVDESKKIIAGAKVRIKLLQDIYVGDHLLQAGTFLYGMVTGFQTQRVNIPITNINYNGVPLPVRMDIYDNDGYLGLYVPGSNFREFTKEIGTQSTQGLSTIQQASATSTDVGSGLISKLFSTGTNTVGKIISQNKVELKSDYIIFLKENKTSTSKY